MKKQNRKNQMIAKVIVITIIASMVLTTVLWALQAMV